MEIETFHGQWHYDANLSSLPTIFLYGKWKGSSDHPLNQTGVGRAFLGGWGEVK